MSVIGGSAGQREPHSSLLESELGYSRWEITTILAFSVFFLLVFFCADMSYGILLLGFL